MAKIDHNQTMTKMPKLLKTVTSRTVMTKHEYQQPKLYHSSPLNWHGWLKSLLQQDNIDGLVQDCSNSIANALELLQSCTKPSILY